MQSNYINWFDVVLNHNYFYKGVFKSFVLLPFKESARAMKNYQIMQSKNDNQVTFFIADQEQTLSENLKGLDNIYFQILNQDNLFFNYTNLPFLNENQLYYFENLEDGGLKTEHLATPSDLFEKFKKSFNLSLSIQNSLIEVKTLKGISVFSTNSNGVQNLPINLVSLEDGPYQLWINNELKKHIFLSDEELNQNCIGIINLNIEQLLNNSNASKKLKISFDARSAYFEYQVVIPPNRKIDVKDMSIATPDGEAYTGPQEQEIIGQQKANVFTSKTAFQLQHKTNTASKLALTYANNFSNRNNQLQRDLPYPEINGLKKYNAENGQQDYLLTTIVYV